MWSSAVSLSLLLAASSPPIAKSDQDVWDAVRKSVLTITAPLGGKSGVAALIDSKGLFLADRAGIAGDSMMGKTSDGLIIPLDLVGVDDPTQLALLRARIWIEPGRKPFTVARSKEVQGKPVLIVLPSGPIRGEVAAGDRVGVLQPTMRYLPLAEIRFETTAGRLGGALAFTADGKLAGVLSATLEALPKASNAMRGAPNAGQFGPAGLTVGYGLGADVLARVVEGFRSPSGKVRHPYVGAFFRDAEGGALVDRVVAGSPSAVAGLAAGDVIVSIDGESVEDALGLAAKLFRLQVGQRIRVEVLRGPERAPQTIDVVVGTQ